MIIDGKAILRAKQDTFRHALARVEKIPALAVILVGEHPATRSFIRIKEKFGQAIGVPVEVFVFDAEADEALVLEKINVLGRDPSIGGLVVQLPLPERFNRRRVLDAVPKAKDIDLLSTEAKEDFAKAAQVERDRALVPPVVGAIKTIFEECGVTLKGKRALVVGRGELVGDPVARWLSGRGALVETAGVGEDFETSAKEADIIISGAGSAGIITPDIVKAGAVVIDAGTSEDAGELKGDADPACAEKCSVFTPVPGGVGPITVACLFENLLRISGLVASGREGS